MLDLLIWCVYQMLRIFIFNKFFYWFIEIFIYKKLLYGFLKSKRICWVESKNGKLSFYGSIYLESNLALYLKIRAPWLLETYHTLTEHFILQLSMLSL